MHKEIPLIHIDVLREGMKLSFKIDDLTILLIKTNGKIHVIENRCGHFGESLENGRLGKNDITCLHHSVKFNLEDGHVMNDVVEHCERLKILNWKLIGQLITVLP